MILEGRFKKNNERWIGSIPDLNILDIQDSEKKLFLSLHKLINETLKSTNGGKLVNHTFSIKKMSRIKFFISFDESKYVTAILLKNLRNKEYLTQLKISELLKIEKGSYGQYECAKREPSLSQFEKFLKALGYELKFCIEKIDSKKNC